MELKGFDVQILRYIGVAIAVQTTYMGACIVLSIFGLTLLHIWGHVQYSPYMGTYTSVQARTCSIF